MSQTSAVIRQDLRLPTEELVQHLSHKIFNLQFALPTLNKKMLYRLDYRYFDENIFPIEVSLPEKCIFYSFDTELAKMVGLNLAKVM